MTSIQDLEREINDLKNSQKKEEDIYNSALKVEKTVMDKVVAREKELVALNNDVLKVRATMSDSQRKISDIQAKLAQHQTDLKRLQIDLEKGSKK